MHCNIHTCIYFTKMIGCLIVLIKPFITGETSLNSSILCFGLKEFSVDLILLSQLMVVMIEDYFLSTLSPNYKYILQYITVFLYQYCNTQYIRPLEENFALILNSPTVNWANWAKLKQGQIKPVLQLFKS